MPSFFRSANEVTSSTEDSERTSSSYDTFRDHGSNGASQLYKLQTINTGSNGGNAELLSLEPAVPALGTDRELHKDYLLHVLLEKDCLREALSEFNESGNNTRYTVDDPEVSALAKAKYRNISQHLESHGLVRPGLHDEGLSNIRQRYRQGLEYLQARGPSRSRPGALQSRQGSATALLPSLKNVLGLSTASRALNPVHGQAENAFAMQKSFAAALPRVLQPLVQHPMLDSSRYCQDFTEVEVLGRGGYGKVFQVIHRLDGSHYAVKKIPLSPSRIERIHARGQAELDTLLIEIRTLARLDHPNIVRYYGGWLEFGPATLPASQSVVLGPSWHRLLQGPTDDVDQGSISNISNQKNPPVDAMCDTAVSDVNVVFEASHSERSIRMDGDGKNEGPAQCSSPRQRRASQATITSTQSKRSTIHSVAETEGEVEAVLRSVPSVDGWTSSEFRTPEDMLFQGYPYTESDPTTSHSPGIAFRPSLTLHIQMSLHPLTLSDYLSSAASIEDFHIRHCFHLRTSLQILLTVLDGVEYLHAQGVVHRDLKPSNIFLSIFNGPRCPLACVNTGSCPDCAVVKDRNPVYVNVRIGDFGLVNAIARHDEVLPSTASRAVGTELYQPPIWSGHSNGKLDVYALGVIAFELLWKFETRMERYETLQNLKRGVVPPAFASRHGSEMEECILGMLHDDEEDRLSCAQVRQRLDGILASTATPNTDA